MRHSRAMVFVLLSFAGVAAAQELPPDGAPWSSEDAQKDFQNAHPILLKGLLREQTWHVDSANGQFELTPRYYTDKVQTISLEKNWRRPLSRLGQWTFRSGDAATILGLPYSPIQDDKDRRQGFLIRDGKGTLVMRREYFYATEDGRYEYRVVYDYKCRATDETRMICRIDSSRARRRHDPKWVHPFKGNSLPWIGGSHNQLFVGLVNPSGNLRRAGLRKD